MKLTLTHLLLCGAFVLGCGGGESEEWTESERAVLVRMERISNLWSNDYRAAYQEIKVLGELNPTSSFFRSAALCRRYVKFVNTLEALALPVHARYFYANRSFLTLTDPLAKSAKVFPRNDEFLFMVDAEYFRQLRQEYDEVCAQLEREPPVPADPPGPRLIQFASLEEMRQYHRHADERRERKNRVPNLKSRKWTLNLYLKSFPGTWFDAPGCRDRINAIPEPRRTELIDYIESRLGRRMKWRE